MEMTYI